MPYKLGAVVAGLTLAAATLAPAPASADRDHDQRYVAKLLDLDVGVTPDNVTGYVQDAVAVCRGLDRGYSPVDNMKYLMNGVRTRDEASAIVVSAIEVYCPWHTSQLG